MSRAIAPLIWLTSVETSEPVGIAPAAIAMIEQKPAAEGHVVAIFLDNGQEVRVIESLAEVRRRLGQPCGPARTP